MENAPTGADQPRVYYLDGVPAQASGRYRVFNSLEQLRLIGAEGILLPQGYEPDTAFSKRPAGPAVLIVHRAPWDERLAALLEAARSQGMRVLYDIDDLVFEPLALPWVRALSRLTDAEVELYEDGVRRYFRALKSCDGVLTTTRALAMYAAAEGVPAFVHRNGLDERTLDTAEAARQVRQQQDEVVLYYGSGTPTHDVDFYSCGRALERLMHKYSSLHLMVQGDVQLDYGLALFEHRVRRWPWMPWPDYFWGIAQADINIAPLELGNPFCEVKSELKWFEAAIMGIPTVASATDAFKEVIRPGENGFLAQTQAEWFEILDELIGSAGKRESTGANAEAEVKERYTPQSMGRQLVNLLTRVVGAPDLTGLAKEMGESAVVPSEVHEALYEVSKEEVPASHPALSIAFLATAPVKGGGGTRNILRQARYLQSFGHEVTIYVEPFGLFKSEGELQSFIEKNFPGDRVRVVLGLDRVEPADAVIATLWLTAERLRTVDGCRGKFYLVQDFEPYFFPMGEEYLRAEATYRFGFHHVTSGRWCTKYLREHYQATADHFDFPLDRQIYYPRPVADDRPRPRVLFFSRPEMPRRCYNLGIQALKRLHERMPEARITLFGSDEVDPKSVPFEVLKNISDLDRLAELYSSADAALVISTTNTSLVPFEVAACGCPVVDIDLEVNRVNYMGSSAMYLAAAEPQALADALYELLNDDDLRARHREAGLRLAEQLPNEEQAARRVEQILLEGLGLAQSREGRQARDVSVNGASGQLDGLVLDVTCRRQDGVLGELQPGKEIAQTFRSTEANLAAVAVKTALYGRTNHCSLEMTLYEDGGDTPIQRIRKSVKESDDNGWVIFRFPGLADSAEKGYRFVISSPDAGPGNACGLYHSRQSAYRAGKLYANGRSGKGALVFQTFVERLDSEAILRRIRPERASAEAGYSRNGATGAKAAALGRDLAPQLRGDLQSLAKRLQQIEQRQADTSRRVADLHNFLVTVRSSLPYRATRKVARLLRLSRR